MSWYVKIGQKSYHSHTVISMVLATMIYFEMCGGRSYFDEGLALVCMVYVTILLIKEIGRSRSDIGVFLIAVIVIGVYLIF